MKNELTFKDFIKIYPKLSTKTEFLLDFVVVILIPSVFVWFYYKEGSMLYNDLRMTIFCSLMCIVFFPFGVYAKYQQTLECLKILEENKKQKEEDE